MSFCFEFQRKQKDVARENEYYMQLLQEALPLSLQESKQSQPQPVDCHTVTLEKGKGLYHTQF